MVDLSSLTCQNLQSSSDCILFLYDLNNSTSAVFAISFFILFIVPSSLCWSRRRRTKRLLEECGLPTLHWRPRFVRYRPFEEDQKLASTTITRMLPRMERLGGPFGMYGTVYGVSTAVVHVAHPVPAKAIFGSGATTKTSNNGLPSKKSKRRFSLFDTTGASKAPAYDHFKNFCGEGVFTADGEDWKAKRASVIHSLIKGTSEASKRLELEANRAANTFCSQIVGLQKSQKTDHPTMNVVPLLQRSTVGLIYRYITHHEPEWGLVDQNCDNHEQSPFTKTAASAAAEKYKSTPSSTGLLQSYLDSIIRIRMIILAQSRSIWFLLPRWCYQFFSSLYQDEERTVIPIRQFAKDACTHAKPGSPLAKLKERGSHDGGEIYDGGISKDLLDETITLLFAGQDTSAATLSWTLHLLSLYPSVQSKLADEIDRVVQDDGLSTDNPVITKSSILKMPYLDAVIKESMRLYPVAPFVVRRLAHNLPIHEERADAKNPITVLPAGSLACVWIYGLHRNPLIWDRPNDFLPERWIDPELKDVGQTNGAYMPFAAGPRNCVGQPLAYIILRTILSKLISKYEFRDERLENVEEPADLRKDMQAGFTVLPSGGVTLTILERRR